jgi:hypothetical protein
MNSKYLPIYSNVVKTQRLSIKTGNKNPNKIMKEVIVCSIPDKPHPKFKHFKRDISVLGDKRVLKSINRILIKK